MNPLLTIIIPFKNEGEEVHNTVQSLLEQAGCDVSLILINDASDDGFDYKSVAESFGAIYVEHSTTYGVAASREHGIALCATEYFIFFDAHMRAFTENWASKLLKHLKGNRQVVFCCATSAITKENKATTSNIIKGYGATIDLTTLQCSWNQIESSTNTPVVKTPCIMGASYASNISYWKRLRGLSGLRGYGYDEPFISMKVALEGGECQVIKDIIFGHIFRKVENVPYTMNDVDVTFNALYIAELLYPPTIKASFFHNLKCLVEESCFEKAMKAIKEYRDMIMEAKTYYKSIFTRNFSYIIELNKI